MILLWKWKWYYWLFWMIWKRFDWHSNRTVPRVVPKLWHHITHMHFWNSIILKNRQIQFFHHFRIFHKTSNKRKDGSKHHTTTFDTVLESWDFILFNEKILGTIGVPFWVPFGTQSIPINVEISKKCIFYIAKKPCNGTQNSTPVVPKMSNGTPTPWHALYNVF